MNDIERQQPTADELPTMYRKIKSAARRVTGLTLDSIEYNPNYIGLFVHVYYGGHEMCFMLSYNQLRRYGVRSSKLSLWIAGHLKRMAEKQLAKRGAKTFIAFRAQQKAYKIRRDPVVVTTVTHSDRIRS